MIKLRQANEQQNASTVGFEPTTSGFLSDFIEVLRYADIRNVWLTVLSNLTQRSLQYT